MHFIIFKDKADEYRWRLQARNGKIIADSAEGYTLKSGAKRAVNNLNSKFKSPLKIYE